MDNLIIKTTQDQNELVKTLCELIEKVANDSITNRGKFIVGLSGGSLVDFLCRGLPDITTDWSKWIFLFCDERIVEYDNNDSTFGVYKARLLPHLKVKESQFITIDHELNPVDCAESYCKKMKGVFKDETLPRFDMLLLGMGPDGHTCSLFPEHSALLEDIKWVVSIEDSPKPPPQRITLTLPVINNARTCVFALSGEGKAAMVKRIIDDKEGLPAGLVNLSNGSLFWILDKGAASLLNM